MLHLYVWEDFEHDYTPGLAFAIAKNEKEARELIRAVYGDARSLADKPKVYPLSKKIAFAVHGGG